MATRHPAVLLVVCVLVWCSCLVGAVTQPADARLDYDGSMRLKHPTSYFIVAPRQVRPNQEIQLYISILVLKYSHVTVHASVQKDGHQYTSLQEHFTTPSTRTSYMKMPDNAESGDYTLVVEGVIDTRGGRIFRNETKLQFSSKQVTVFLQTDQELYQKSTIVTYRAYAVAPNLLPVPSGSIDIYVKDAAGRYVRRWLSQQVRNGYFEGSFNTGHPQKYGTWTIEVYGWGHKYVKEFERCQFYYEYFDLNITMPAYIYDNEYALGGVVAGNLTQNNMPVQGNGTLELEILPPGDGATVVTITKDMPFFEAVRSFQFTLEEIKQTTGLSVLAGTKLTLYASVYDWFSKTQRRVNSQCEIYTSDYSIEFMGGTVRTFKPNLPMPVYIAVYGKAGTTFERGRYNLVFIGASVREVSGNTRTYDEVGYVIPDDSVVRYSFTPGPKDEMVTIRAAYGNRQSYKELKAWRHYAIRNHYIYVTSSTAKARLDHYVVFTVRTTLYVPEIHYQIVANGNLVTASGLYMKSSQKTFALAASRDMIPEATIVVYCIMSDGEVLTDSLVLHVEGIDTTGVELEISKGKDFTGDSVEIVGRTDPGTFMTLAGADYDFYGNKGLHSFLTKTWLEDDLGEYGQHTNNSFKHTFYGSEYRSQNVYFNAPCHAIDANTTFQYAGLVVFTDANLVRVPGSETCNHTRGYLPCHDGSCYLVEQRCDGVWQCQDGADEMGCPTPSDVSRPDTFSNLYYLFHYLDSHQWAWKGFYTKPYAPPDNTYEFILDVPLRPATWVIQGIALSSENGLAFNDIPIRLETTRAFYMEVELPSSSILGEQVAIQVSLFNYWHQTIEVILTLRGSDEFRFVAVETFGIVSSYNPRTLSGDIQTMVYLESGETRMIHFPIVPTKYPSSFKATVEADSIVRSQKKTVSLSAGMDGVTNHWHTPYLIDLVNSGSQFIPHLLINVPERFIDPEERTHLYVPGSNTATVSSVGDVVGPGFTTGHLSAKYIFGNIGGQGDHYLFDLGINMYWLKFLQETHQLDEGTLKSALSGMNADLQKVYAYIRADGGMGMRQSNTPTSVWMTSVGLHLLAQCKFREWEDTLFIDTKVLNDMTLWLTGQQDPNTGAFPQTADTYDFRMKSNLTNDNGVPMNISLTAYAVIALDEALIQLNGEAGSAAVHAITLATEFLYSHLYELRDPFEICVVTYALHVTGHNARGDAFRMMRDIARTNEYRYWSPEAIPPMETVFIDNIPYLSPRYEPLPHQSSAIQATAYALLVYLRNNWLQEAVPIMKWLNSQRNVDTGFDFVHDTLWATKALAEFAKTETNRDFYNMAVELRAPSSPGWIQNVHMGSANIEQSASVPSAWGSVISVAQGTGYSLLQLDTHVNVEYPWQLRAPEMRAFDLELGSLVFSGRNHSLMDMDVCITWLATQLGPRSGSVVLEVDIPTGWYVTKASMKFFQRKGRIDSQRSIFSAQRVVMYIDYIDTNQSCWHISAERWYPVANLSIQHRMRVYDTSEWGLQNTSMYNTWGPFHNHICQVCGSFQCPFCPFYNAASTLGVRSSPYLHACLLVFVMRAAWTLWAAAIRRV